MASSINASTSGAGGVITTADATGILNLQTASTTAVTVNASQNVGIGTTSPSASYKLTIAGTASSSGIYQKRTDSINGAGGVYAVGSDDVVDAGITLGGGSDQIVTITNAGTECMRIDSSGNVLIGATSLPPGASATRFYVVQPAADYSAFFVSSSATAANNYGPFIKYTAASPNNGTNEFLACVDSSATRMTVRSNGGIANYSANDVNLSDEREKKNIELAGSYLDKICAIPVKTFNYIDQNIKEDDGLTLGIIAQDVQAVAPELVMESDWGTKEEPKERLSIYQTDLQYALMKCIQEQQTIINDLKARIEVLEAK